MTNEGSNLSNIAKKTSYIATEVAEQLTNSNVANAVIVN